MDTDKARRLIEAASADLERNEYPANHGPFWSLRSMADRGPTIRRVLLAEAAYLYGTRELRSSRFMDDCFECADADEVAACLAERADRNPALFAAIAADFSGNFPHQWRVRQGALL